MNKREKLEYELRKKYEEITCLKIKIESLCKNRYSCENHDDPVGRSLFKFGFISETPQTHPYCAYDNSMNRSVAWFIEKSKCEEYVDFLNKQ